MSRTKRLMASIAFFIGIFYLGTISTDYIDNLVYALNLSRVKTWGAEVLTHTDLNAEFDNIINHSIVDADVSASAAIARSKISGLGSGDSPQFTAVTLTGALIANGDSITSDGVLVLNATSAVSFNDEAITNVSDIAVDTISADDGVSFAMSNNWTNAGKTIADLGSVTTCDINGGTINGITDLVVVDGGTGAGTFTDGGVLLGSGTGAITAMAVLADSTFIVGDGTTDPVAESGDTVRTSLGLLIGTNVQAYDLQLDDLADGSLSGAGTVNTSALTGTTYLPDATVDTTALKTATAEVTNTNGAQYLTLTGGEYCFFPKQKMSTTNDQSYIGYFMNGTTVGFTTYATCIYVSCTAGGTQYFTTRYVTASGEDYWIFILVDKLTKEIKSMSAAPDHPAYGNSNDFIKQPSPFGSFDPSTQDIVLIEKEQAKMLQIEAKEKRLGVLELIENNYKIDFSQTYLYIPTHSGQYSPDSQPVLVETIPNYITVRKLVKLTEQDKKDKKDRIDVLIAEEEAKKSEKKARVNQLKGKLGLSDEEFELLRDKL